MTQPKGGEKDIMKARLKIEPNMPIPTPRTHYSILSDMEVGDSILFENKNIKLLLQAICHWKKHNGCKFTFTARTIENDVRLWRVS